jgi:hypothetical protein
MPHALGWILRRIAAHLPAWARPRPQVADPQALAGLLDSQAAFTSQKCTVEYLRLRGGLDWEELRRSPAFRAGLERCRWEGYALALGEVAEVCEIFLRHRGVDAAAVAALVPPAAVAALARHPVPAHRADWDDIVAALTARLAEARAQAPRHIRHMGDATARRLMDLYPFDARLRAADLDYLRNNLRLTLAQAYERMGREVDVARLVGPAGLEPATRPL